MILLHYFFKMHWKRIKWACLRHVTRRFHVLTQVHCRTIITTIHVGTILKDSFWPILMESSRNPTFTVRFWLKCSSMKYQAWIMHQRNPSPTQSLISFRMYKMYCMYSASLSKFLSTCTYGNWNAMTSDLFRINRPESRDRETEFWHVWQFNLWLWTLIFPISSFRKDHPADLG